MHLCARCAVEWLMASGDRTAARLRGLVDHFCDSAGIAGEERDHIRSEALAAARRWPGFTE